MKQKLESLEEDRDLLIQLVSTLRESTNSHVIHFLNLIRSNASLEEIKAHIDAHPYTELEKTPELIDAASQISHMRDTDYRSRRRFLDVHRLSDIPLWKVPAKPWTRLTDDDDFVSHLVSLWFTWYHPYCNWIDRDLFIRDMQSGETEKSRYCSAFLVNIILADACVC